MACPFFRDFSFLLKIIILHEIPHPFVGLGIIFLHNIKIFLKYLTNV